MKIIQKKIQVNTTKKLELINITRQIKTVVGEVSIDNGLVNIFTKHTTSAIIINEDENGLKKDFIKYVEKLVPNDDYNHDLIDNNAKSHLMAMITSSNQNIPIINRNLNIGTWQSIFFMEFDGPRCNRTVNLTFIGE